jgi:hypothetical protein
MSIFDDVRGRVSIAQAIDYLGLKPTETKGDQLRFGCPACKGADKRCLSVNLQKGFQCFAAHKKGDDATALVAHCKRDTERTSRTGIEGSVPRQFHRAGGRKVIGAGAE